MTHENIEAVTARGATIYAPPAKSRNPEIDPCEPKKDDPPDVAAWRLRMKTEDAKLSLRARRLKREIAKKAAA